MKPFLLYHWSPTDRRASIKRRGFTPGSRSVDGDWKPPYVCFSDSPSLAWALSGRVHPAVPAWDLWMVWSDIPSGYEVLYSDSTKQPKEYRVHERIWKRDIWYVASRDISKAREIGTR